MDGTTVFLELAEAKRMDGGFFMVMISFLRGG